MSIKTPTPIQQAIEELELRLFKELYGERDSGYNQGITNAILVLKSKLPAERKFAEECFNAGEKYGDILKGYDDYYPDFSTFYKNNYEI